MHNSTYEQYKHDQGTSLELLINKNSHERLRSHVQARISHMNTQGQLTEMSRKWTYSIGETGQTEMESLPQGSF